MARVSESTACLVCEVQERPQHVLCSTCLDDEKIQLICKSCGEKKELSLEEAQEIIRGSLRDDVRVALGMTFVYSDKCPLCARSDEWLSYILFRVKRDHTQ